MHSIHSSPTKENEENENFECKCDGFFHVRCVFLKMNESDKEPDGIA